MSTFRCTIRLCLCLAFAGCAGPAPPPAPQAIARPPAQKVPHPKAAPDWFHRQLALAHHARVTHLPPGDKAGAQRAYDAVILPACTKIAASGPAKYRAQCRAMVQRAASTASALAESPACQDDSSDAPETADQVTACSD